MQMMMMVMAREKKRRAARQLRNKDVLYLIMLMTVLCTGVSKGRLLTSDSGNTITKGQYYYNFSEILVLYIAPQCC